MASRIVARVTPSGDLLIGGSAFLGEEVVRFTPKGDLRAGQIIEGGSGFSVEGATLVPHGTRHSLRGTRIKAVL